MAATTTTIPGKSLSGSFTHQLSIPQEVEQIAPEQLVKMLKRTGIPLDDGLHIIDVRQPSEFAARSIRGSQNVPHDVFDPSVICQQLSSDLHAGIHPLVVFVSAQSPDIDMDCALTFVDAWESLGFQEEHHGTPGHRLACTLLGGLRYWFESNVYVEN